MHALSTMLCNMLLPVGYIMDDAQEMTYEGPYAMNINSHKVVSITSVFICSLLQRLQHNINTAFVTKSHDAYRVVFTT
jgi:hypothetical protein